MRDRSLDIISSHDSPWTACHSKTSQSKTGEIAGLGFSATISLSDVTTE